MDERRIRGGSGVSRVSHSDVVVIVKGFGGGKFQELLSPLKKKKPLNDYHIYLIVPSDLLKTKSFTLIQTEDFSFNLKLKCLAEDK